MQTRQKLLIPLCLLTLYFVWGSTYIAMKFAIVGFPPFLMAALRFLCAGAVLYAVLRMRGVPHPTLAEWRGAALIGLLQLSLGNGCVAWAQQWVESGAAALVIATVPLCVAVFSGAFGEWPHRREWLGIAIGFAGMVILNLDKNMQAVPLAAFVILLSAASWGMGSVLGRRIALPQGIMASAAQMLGGGAFLVVASALQGERLAAWPDAQSWLALAYLIVFGSVIAYSAYIYVLPRVRPLVATSHAFVNPVVALLLGVWLAGEAVGVHELLAMMAILGGVLLVLVPAQTLRELLLAILPGGVRRARDR